MSLVTNANPSIAPSVASSRTGSNKSEVFQDMPFMDKQTRLTVIELKHSDKQVVNELVYRWCRILTRGKSESMNDNRRVLIIDMIGSVSLTRLAVVLREDYSRMRMIDMIKSCKINSTYITLNSYLGENSNLSKTIKLAVIYQDEFYIQKTLSLMQDFLPKSICKVLLIVPRLDRSERDVLNLISNYQILRCDFHIKRREIGPALTEDDEAYQASLNKVFFQRNPAIKPLPDTVYAYLRIDGLSKSEVENEPPTKRIKSEAHNTSF